MLIFTNDSTQVESQLFARYGRYMENQDKVLLQDSVIVFNIKGDTLRTDELWWDQNKGTFNTDKPVSIRKGHSDIIEAIGMTATQDLDDINLFKIQPSTFLHVADSTLPE
jgi:LPS export ABC transporter protein LptC